MPLFSVIWFKDGEVVKKFIKADSKGQAKRIAIQKYNATRPDVYSTMFSG